LRGCTCGGENGCVARRRAVHRCAAHRAAVCSLLGRSAAGLTSLRAKRGGVIPLPLPTLGWRSAVSHSLRSSSRSREGRPLVRARAGAVFPSCSRCFARRCEGHQRPFLSWLRAAVIDQARAWRQPRGLGPRKTRPAACAASDNRILCVYHEREDARIRLAWVSAVRMSGCFRRAQAMQQRRAHRCGPALARPCPR